MNKRIAAAIRIQRLRLDPTKSAARYDEIIKLRMKLLDIVYLLKDDARDLDGRLPDCLIRLQERIEEMAKSWGKKGDCV